MSRLYPARLERREFNRRVYVNEAFNDNCSAICVIATQIVSVFRYISLPMQKHYLSLIIRLTANFRIRCILLDFAYLADFLRNIFQFSLQFIRYGNFFSPLEDTSSLPLFLSLPLGRDNCNLPVLATFSHIGNGIRALCKFSPLVRSECSDAIFAFLYEQPTVSPFLTDSAGTSMNLSCAPGVFRGTRDANGL